MQNNGYNTHNGKMIVSTHQHTSKPKSICRRARRTRSHIGIDRRHSASRGYRCRYSRTRPCSWRTLEQMEQQGRSIRYLYWSLHAHCWRFTSTSAQIFIVTVHYAKHGSSNSRVRDTTLSTIIGHLKDKEYINRFLLFNDIYEYTITLVKKIETRLRWTTYTLYM